MYSGPALVRREWNADKSFCAGFGSDEGAIVWTDDIGERGRSPFVFYRSYRELLRAGCAYLERHRWCFRL